MPLNLFAFGEKSQLRSKTQTEGSYGNERLIHLSEGCRTAVGSTTLLHQTLLDKFLHRSYIFRTKSFAIIWNIQNYPTIDGLVETALFDGWNLRTVFLYTSWAWSSSDGTKFEYNIKKLFRFWKPHTCVRVWGMSIENITVGVFRFS